MKTQHQNTFRKSLKRYWYFKSISKEESVPEPLMLCHIGDRWIKDAQIFAAAEIAQQINCDLKKRKEISDWARRHCTAKIRIGKYTYYLIKK